MRARALEVRFWEKVDKDGPVPAHKPQLGPCWVWLASLNDGRYGQIAVNRRPKRAHRLSYAWARGPIPSDKEIDHLCRVRHCVNPDHLEAVFRRENVRRGMAGHATGAKNRAKDVCPARHEYTKANTYRDSRGCRHCRECRRLMSAKMRAKNPGASRAYNREWMRRHRAETKATGHV